MKNLFFVIMLALVSMVFVAAGTAAAGSHGFSLLGQNGEEEFGPASSGSQQGDEEMSPAVPAPHEIGDEMLPATSGSQQGTEEMSPAGSSSHEEYMTPKNAPYKAPVENQPY
jgi:hypothetical protein